MLKWHLKTKRGMWEVRHGPRRCQMPLGSPMLRCKIYSNDDKRALLRTQAVQQDVVWALVVAGRASSRNAAARLREMAAGTARGAVPNCSN